MEKKYCRAHIGKLSITNEGYEVKVIDGGVKNLYCTIQIDDYITEVQYSKVKTGQIKYPFHQSVFGEGYFGVGEYSAKTHLKAYRTWQGMLQRCYSYELHCKHPTYTKATVCDEWLNFQNFVEWYERNFREGFELDKDLLVPGNKKYSPKTCIFIPQRLNVFLATTHSNNTSGYTGVTWDNQRKKWKATICTENTPKCLGRFKTAEEASEAYKQARKIEATKLQELYKDILPVNVVELIK